jgi:hypothetical protein
MGRSYMSEVIFKVDNKNVSDMISQICAMINKGLFKGPVEVVLRRTKRTDAQNRKLQPMVRDIKTQVEWMNLTNEKKWREFFCGIIKGQNPSITPEGNVIMLGVSSTELSVEQMSECIEYMYHFGSERQVKWSEPSLQLYSEYKEAA